MLAAPISRSRRFIGYSFMPAFLYANSGFFDHREPGDGAGRYTTSVSANIKPQDLEYFMDKDRIEGSATQAKGAMKKAAGKVTGDSKLKAEGAADKAAGKVQNAVGGVKDAIRDASKH